MVTTMEATDGCFHEIDMLDIDKITNWHSSEIFPYLLSFFLLVNASQRRLDRNASLIVYFLSVYSQWNNDIVW